MILTLQGPEESLSTTISVSDIVRVEERVLKFFDKKIFNFYIIVKSGKDESFYLFSYTKHQDFMLAHTSLSKALSEVPRRTKSLRIEPNIQRVKNFSNGALA